MKRFLTLALLFVALSVQAEEGQPYHLPFDSKTLFGSSFKKDYQEVKMPEYKPLDEISWSGIPLFLAGIFIKGEKDKFQQNYNDSHVNARLVSSFSTSIDDYLQYFGPAMTLGLKVSGVEGRSDWIRFLSSAVMTYACEAILVNGIKYTSRELRPDGSTRNSWPSGHTATAFAGATLLHKEYGLTRSPWYSVLGYSVATSTAVMRVLNNRHWVSDVFSGAGIGIMSGELAYALSHVIFKNQRLVTDNLAAYQDLRTNPSFFGLSMGVGFGSHHLDFEDAEDMPSSAQAIKLSFQTATVVGIEGAYFLTKNVGVGGRLRVSTMPIKGWNDFIHVGYETTQKDLEQLLNADKTIPQASIDAMQADLVTNHEYEVISGHLAEFSLDGGLYFNFPLSSRLAIGTKALVGGSTMQSLDISAHYAGKQKTLLYDMTVKNNELSKLTIHDFTTKQGADCQPLTYDSEWDFFLLSGSRSMKYGTGVSLTYAHNNNFSWRVFVDYDYTRKSFTLTYNPNEFMRTAMPEVYGLATLLNYDLNPKSYTLERDLHRWTLGAAFNVSF